jgi:nitrous oxide reductase accessory protein NosL
MRKLVLLIPVVLLLAGCSQEWSGEVRFKVREIAEVSSGPLVALDVEGEKPKGIEVISSATAKPDQFPADIKAGEIVVCQVKQTDEDNLDGGNTRTDVGPCRRA